MIRDLSKEVIGVPAFRCPCLYWSMNTIEQRKAAMLAQAQQKSA